MNDGQEMMESGQPLPPPQLPDAFAQGSVPPPLPPEYGVIPPTMPLPGAASASNPTPVSHRRRPRRTVFVALGIALAMVALVAGGIVFAAQSSPPAASSAAPSTGATSTLPKGSKRTEVVYTVTAVNGGSIAATESDNGAAVTITTSAQTAVVRGGRPASLSDITAGTKLHVKGHKKAGTITAKRIEIVLPAVEGKVTGIAGNTITVRSKTGSVTVTVSDTTLIVDAQTRQTITLGSIQPGEKIRAEGNQNSGGSLDALYILVGAKSGNSGPPPLAGPTPTGTVTE